MRRTILIISMLAVVVAGTAFFSRSRVQAQNEPQLDERPAAEIPPDVVEMVMPEELRGYQVVVARGSSPKQECIMMQRIADLDASGMCIFEWAPGSWPVPLKSSMPIGASSDGDPEAESQGVERAAVVVMAAPDREFVVRTPSTDAGPSVEIPIEMTSGQVEIDGEVIAIHAFATDESFDDQRGSGPDYEVVYA